MSNPFKKVKNEIKKGAKKAKQALKNQPSPKKEAQADQLKNTTEELAKEKLINADLKALVEKLGLNKAFEILKQLEDQNIELKDQLDASEVNVGLLKEEKTELEAQKKSLESEKEKLDIQNQELESKNTELQNKKEELKSESKKFISWANGMKNLYKNLKADKLKVDEEITKLKKQLEEKAAELEQITEQKAELEKQIADSKQDVSKTFAEKMLNYLDDAKSPQEVVELLKKDFIDNTKVIEFIELMSKELISDLKILLEDVTGEIADQKFKEELESKVLDKLLP